MRLGPTRRTAAGGLLGLAVALPATAAAAPHLPSAAAPGVSIELQSVTPAVTAPGGSAVLKGLVRNTGATPLTLGAVRLVASDRTTETAPAVRAWAEGTAVARGVTVTTSPVAGALPPGGSTAFTLTLRRPEDWSTELYGVLPVSIEAGGVARHTFVGFVERPPTTPLGTTWLVPATLPADPDLWAEGAAERTAAWGAAVGPGSPVDQRLDAVAGTGAGVLADPTLLASQTSPTPAPAPSPDSTPDAEATTRAAAVTRLRAVLSEGHSAVLPTGDPDVAAPPGPTLVTEVTRLASAAQAQVAPATAPVLLWPVDGSWPSTRANAFGPLAGRPVLVNSTATGGGPFKEGRSTLLPIDADLTDALVRASSTTASPPDVQELLAETAVGSRQRSGSVVVLPTRDAVLDPVALRSVLTTVTAAPWLRTVPPSELVRAGASSVAPRTTPATTRTTPPSVLDATSTRTLSDLGRRTRAIASVRDDAGSGQRWLEAVDQLWSVRWRSAPAGWHDINDRITSVAKTTAEGVQVVPTTVNFLADSGRLQLVVTNDLDVAVHDLRVTLTPDVPILRVETPPEPLRIGAHSRTTVTVQVTALASGPVRLHTRLSAPDGTDIGPGTTVTIHATPTGTFTYWVLGTLAVLLVAAGIWRGRRRKAAAEGTAEGTAA